MSQFIRRHIGPSEAETKAMLEYIGAKDMADLVHNTIPPNIRLKGELDLPDALSEEEMIVRFREIASKNDLWHSYIGYGYYNCYTPAVIQRNILENPGWYTQYTPYQAEIAQGRLEALINYQTLVTELTGLEIANASLLDEATAAAEAMALLWNKSKKKHGNKFFVSDMCFPQTIDVLKTRAEHLGIDLTIGKVDAFEASDEVFGVLFQYPDVNGGVVNRKDLTSRLKASGIGVAVAADLMSLLLLEAPGAWGADVVFGTSQRFGVPMGYGGPHAAYFATAEANKRIMPGRIIGVSMDTHGNPALRMALQTREQHIRRDKATSNICTAQVLLAIMAGMYAVYHGPEGLRKIASDIHKKTSRLAASLNAIGYDIENKTWFDTLSVVLDQEKIKEIAEKGRINFAYFRDGVVSIALDETVTEQALQNILDVFAEAKGIVKGIGSDENSPLRGGYLRTDEPLTPYEVFSKYHSETEMLRYIKRLEGRDLSLAHSMIPLGSCTMKLNATTEMVPVTWAEFGSPHPFVPNEQMKGYNELFTNLEHDLAEITGLDAVSLQPNAGAQGEYTGLLMIKAYHKSIGQAPRSISLIPSSAHGTNPASAVMAGMKVVVVACDDQGNISVKDLKDKISQHSENLSSLMVTYPSTHGVFEEEIVEICDLIHAAGGQVYMDGANMNAQVGLTSPGIIGADVCHLNLHKTFCIPHGGGGPGVGPIAVKEHLAKFLPGHVINSEAGGSEASSAVSAAPWGSASILVISYAYIRMMGSLGLRNATEMAILNANYIKDRLKEDYDILYTGVMGRAAHEMIVDFREYKKTAGVEVEDVAKRLMDYGFHAPTVSFPVAGTLMIEPTESEGKEELDRFCDALLMIRKEIARIESGEWDHENNPLKNAPHTTDALLREIWDFPYSRKEAVYPLTWIQERKFWPYVSRVNNPYGDRNLICTCPSPEMFAEESV